MDFLADCMTKCIVHGKSSVLNNEEVLAAELVKHTANVNQRRLPGYPLELSQP